MKRSLKGKRIWVTGASAGIGKALVQELARHDAIIIASSRSLTNLEELQKECQYPNLHLYPFDVSKKENYSKLNDYLITQHGGLDGMILNAGDCIYVDLPKIDSTVFEKMINVNFLAQVYAVEALLPMLIQSKGFIACMASLAAYRGLPRSEAYGASKAAVINFAQALQVDLEPMGVDVSIINPGFVKTPLTDKNDFPMPNRVSPEYAAEIILRELKERKKEIYFPKIFGLILNMIRILPDAISHQITRKFRRKEN